MFGLISILKFYTRHDKILEILNQHKENLLYHIFKVRFILEMFYRPSTWIIIHCQKSCSRCSILKIDPTVLLFCILYFNFWWEQDIFLLFCINSYYLILGAKSLLFWTSLTDFLLAMYKMNNVYDSYWIFNLYTIEVDTQYLFANYVRSHKL